MNVDVQFIKMPCSETLNYFVFQQLEALSDKYGWILKAVVNFIEEEEKTKNSKICEIELQIPGPFLIASSREENFGLATKRAIRELEKQLDLRKPVLKAR